MNFLIKILIIFLLISNFAYANETANTRDNNLSKLFDVPEGTYKSIKTSSESCGEEYMNWKHLGKETILLFGARHSFSDFNKGKILDENPHEKGKSVGNCKTFFVTTLEKHKIEQTQTEECKGKTQTLRTHKLLYDGKHLQFESKVIDHSDKKSITHEYQCTYQSQMEANSP